VTAAEARAGALLAWYERMRRPLPWRATRDPYALLVSEVMLQQTQAARVIPYYEAFLARFPDPPALAAAPPRDVLAAWSGLGYNRRALALQAAARAVAERGWPDDLRELPGVGPYTAAAVAAFAWDEQRAAVDVNVRRAIERWDGRRLAPRALAERAAALLPPGRAADWNQAMMELGATVCTARAARCDACPVAAWCASAGEPAPPEPARAPRPRFEDTDRYARGRIVAALLDGAALPPLEPDRLERALAGLARDGLIVRDAAGAPALP
jgi:A/G-specific adenine glycosylase